MCHYIDLHCHILHGLDDGPQDLEKASLLVKKLKNLGFSDIYPTPHYKPGVWTPSPLQCHNSLNSLRKHIKNTHLQINIHEPAREFIFNDRFLTIDRDSLICYPGNNAFLIEFSSNALPLNLTSHLFQYRIRGTLPVIAHIERYSFLLDTNRDFIRSLGKSACLLINLSSLAGMGGRKMKRICRHLVREGLIHAAATDTHNNMDLKYSETGIKWLKTAVGKEGTDILLRQNPQRILDGHPLESLLQYRD